MGLGGQRARHQLVVVNHGEDAHAVGPQRQEAVVPAPALPEAPPAAIDGERGDEERVDPLDLLRRQDPAAGLRGAPGGPLGQVRRPPVVGPAARQVRAEDRQEHADPALGEALQQQPGAGLVAHGHVGGDAVHPLHRFQRVRGQRLANRVVTAGGMPMTLAPMLTQHLPQPFLRIVDVEPPRVGKLVRLGTHGRILSGP